MVVEILEQSAYGPLVAVVFHVRIVALDVFVILFVHTVVGQVNAGVF
jgi:hypothetical protein